MLTGHSDHLVSTNPDDWGRPVHGVQFWVALTNRTLIRGSPTESMARIRNSSTNAVAVWVDWVAFYQYDIKLADRSNHLYSLVPRQMGHPGGGGFKRIGPGETFQERVPIESVDPDLHQDGYRLTMKKAIFPLATGLKADIEARFEVEAPPVPVRVK